MSTKGRHEGISKETQSLIWSITKSNKRRTCDTFDLTKIKERVYRFDVGADCMGFLGDQSDLSEIKGHTQHMLDMGCTCVMNATNTKGTLWISIWKRFLSVIRMTFWNILISIETENKRHQSRKKIKMYMYEAAIATMESFGNHNIQPRFRQSRMCLHKTLLDMNCTIKVWG